jgi:hypothetical protein
MILIEQIDAICLKALKSYNNLLDKWIKKIIIIPLSILSFVVCW